MPSVLAPEANHQLESIQEQLHRKAEEPDSSPPIHLPTRINVIQTSQIRTATLASSQNSTRAIRRESSDLRVATAALPSDRRQADLLIRKQGPGYSPDASRWNTNNSGRLGTNLSDVKTSLAPSPSHRTASFSSNQLTPIHQSEAIGSNESPRRKSNSLPNINVNSDSSEKLFSNFRLFPSVSSSQLHNPRVNSTRKGSGSSVVDHVVLIDVSPSDDTLTDRLLKSHTVLEPGVIRDRGNTQTSRDSGVIIDTNPTSSVSRDNSPQTRMSDVASDRSLPLSAFDSVYETTKEEQWRFSQPKGEVVEIILTWLFAKFNLPKETLRNHV